MSLPSAAHRAVCLALWLGLIVGGCTPSRAQEPAATTVPPAATAAPTLAVAPTVAPTTAPTAARAATAAVAQPTAAEAPPGSPVPEPQAGVYRAIEGSMARIRGLQPRRDVEPRFMPQAELGDYFRRSFDHDYTPEERARDQKLLVRLGLLRPDQDLTAIMLNLLTEGVAGFYDEDSRRMYVIAETAEPNPSAKVTFAHEYTHALQDEYYDLAALNPPGGDNDDRSAAIQALVEGDATLAMTLYARSELTPDERREYARSQGGGGDVFETAPLVLRDELVFPYVEGLSFVGTLQQRGGYAAVDAAFRDPPQSTEQILHPEKYLAHEAPVDVALPDLAAVLGAGWRQTAGSTLGELDLRILVEQFSDRAAAERAASGWGGDRYALLEDAAGRPALAIKTTWDSSQDAWEFYRAYAQASSTRYGRQARVIARDQERQALAGEGYADLVTLRGQDVLIVLAPDETVMQALAQALQGG